VDFLADDLRRSLRAGFDRAAEDYQRTRPVCPAGLPGAHLAAVARRRLAGYPQASVVTGSFEDWQPARAGFDAVLAVSSLHWIDPELRYAKPYALLRPAPLPGRGPRTLPGGSHPALPLPGGLPCRGLPGHQNVAQNVWNSGRPLCHQISTTLPTMLEPVTGPQYRLSHESARLSPSM
jgi:hypothetical protein